MSAHDTTTATAVSISTDMSRRRRRRWRRLSRGGSRAGGWPGGLWESPLRWPATGSDVRGGAAFERCVRARSGPVHERYTKLYKCAVAGPYIIRFRGVGEPQSIFFFWLFRPNDLLVKVAHLSVQTPPHRVRL